MPEFKYHVRGWNQNVIDAADVPRTWDVSIVGGEGSIYVGVLRIDRNTSGVLVGQLKVFAKNAVLSEELESEPSSISWDGTSLSPLESLLRQR